MKKTIFMISVLFLLLYVLPLGMRPLVIPDEVRYAEIPREMITKGDWIVPHLNGLVYFEKPVMGYWLNGLAIKMFGENAFAVRFFSAISAGLSALMVFFLTSIFLDSRRKGILATSVYLTFFLVYGLGVFSVLDGMFSFFLTACMGFYFFSWSKRESPRSFYSYLVLSGIFCGFAFLTKGFLAFAIPICIIVPFLAWEKDYKMIFTKSWIPILAALIVILPWAFLVHLKAPDFWHFFFWHEHVKRFFSKSAQHKESFFYYFMVLPAALFPWIFLTPASITGLLKKGLKNHLLRYSLCWFFFPFLLFSFSSGKLLTYILPCFPALGILLSTGLINYLDSKRTYWFDKGVFCLMGIAGLLIIALFILQTGIIASLAPFAYKMQWKAILFFTGLILFFFVLKKSLNTTDRTKKILLFAAAPLFFYFSVNFILPDKTILRKCPGELIQKNMRKIDKNTLIFSPSTPLRAVCWFLKRSDVFMLDSGELDYGLHQKKAAGRLVDYRKFYKIASKDRGKRKIALIIDQKAYYRIKNRLPKPEFLDSSGKNGFAFIIF